MLRSAGASPEAADATAKCLVGANRRGIDSHGVVFLRFYLPRLRSGAARGDAHPTIAVDLPALALVDGHYALGAYVADFAMSLCCDKAAEAGAAAVAVRRSGHFGAASHHAEMAASRGFIGITVSNTIGMAPLGALGLFRNHPAGERRARRSGRTAPVPGYCHQRGGAGPHHRRPARRHRDSRGLGHRTGRKADARSRHGSCRCGPAYGRPQGFRPRVHARCTVWVPSRAHLSPEITPDPNSPDHEGTGHCFIAVRVDALQDRADYERSLARLVGFVHGAHRAEWAEPFMIPGEREAGIARERAACIPLPPPSVDLLRSLGAEYGVPFPH